ncbi:uncharacterized protein LOC131226921 [Magnolia sinica]|uniref:uncharacterized protein LOC131226921 n=1 Tax=Magnolia sinica TaxID=86752 RepID=UPI0026590A7C|nr:uncharacterized protein LOC131226921 [Magnolia sinica]
MTAILQRQGEPDPTAAERWRSKVKKIFDTMKCTGEQRVPFAMFLLQGEAKHWWALVSRAVGAEFEYTWEDFVNRFDQKFFPDHVHQQCTLKFETLVQGDMSVSQYEALFITLLRFMTYLVYDAGRKARRFENDLHFGLQSHVIGHMLLTFE